MLIPLQVRYIQCEKYKNVLVSTSSQLEEVPAEGEGSEADGMANPVSAGQGIVQAAMANHMWLLAPVWGDRGI